MVVYELYPTTIDYNDQSIKDFALENKDKISSKDILKLEQLFINYSNLLKEKYFNYGVYANYTVDGDILEK